MTDNGVEAPSEMKADIEKITSLAKRRGFVFPSAEIYGGFAAAYDYGPLGVELKRNIRELWWSVTISLGLKPQS
jgi:glycyl-tRNA synthetase